jgi:hypothetical protein
MTTVAIFDFDLTITKSHTFREHSIRTPKAGEEQKKVTTFNEQYVVGKSDAENNTKSDILDYLKNRDQQMRGIATHHNNPHFIAGYIAYLHQRELEFVKYHSKEDDKAINEYRFVDTEESFFISYIDAYGPEFNRVKNSASSNNKNNQIADIARMINSENQAVEYYDDMCTACRDSILLGYVSANVVNSSSPTFKVKVRIKNPPLRQPELFNASSSLVPEETVDASVPTYQP